MHDYREHSSNQLMSWIAKDSGQWVKNTKHRTGEGMKQYMKCSQVQVRVRSVTSSDLACVLSFALKGFLRS